MHEEKNKKNNQIEDFRYDAKLFRQAYNAGLKAKKREEDLKQKKYLKITFAIIFTVLLIPLLIWVLNSIPTRLNYIEARHEIRNEVFPFLEIENQPSGFNLRNHDEDFVNAKAAMYANLKTGEILYAKGVDEVLPIASLTKLMTALVVLDYFELDEYIEVTESWFEREEIEWSIGFQEGDLVTVRDLLTIALLSSHNDTTYILANHFSGGIESFVNEMNNYAKKFGMCDTNFVNPSGLDGEIVNTSTIADLYFLSIVVSNNRVLMDMLSKFSHEVVWNNGSETVFTTNQTLNQNGNIGGKTGYTKEAGPCFLGFTESGEVTIILNSSTRFGDVKNFSEMEL